MNKQRFVIHDVAEMDLTDGILIECFPTHSPLASLVANFILENLSLDQIAIVDSFFLPAVATIVHGKPKYPIRIYGGRKNDLKIALIVSEIPQYPQIAREIGHEILKWTEEKKISRIYSIEGIKLQNKTKQSESNRTIRYIGSTAKIREKFEEKAIDKLDYGIVSGISAVLLNEGWRRNFDVGVLLIETTTNQPDIDAATQILQVLNDLIPDLDLELQPLFEQGEKIKKVVQDLRESAVEVSNPSSTYDHTYI